MLVLDEHSKNWFYRAPYHMISQLYDWIFVTGEKLGLHLCLSPKIGHGEQ